MEAFHALIEKFKDFPGIGPRQAKRFVYFLLTRDKSYLQGFIGLVEKLKSEMRICNSCQRFFASTKLSLCSICDDNNRNKKLLMIVAKDIDLETIEKSLTYDGQYFVLGGLIPMIEKTEGHATRLNKLVNRVASDVESGLTEIILAMNANPDGEHTVEILIKLLQPIMAKHKITISTLGRGLSTGTELEYSDSDTIKNALKNRH